MNLKAAKQTWTSVILAIGLALGEGAPPAAERGAPEQDPAPVSPPFSEGVADLDFTEDIAADPAPAAGNPGGEVTQRLPRSAAVAARDPSRSWIYWTAGIAATAAGGAAWYLHWGARSAPDPIRDHEVFTDAPD